MNKRHTHFNTTMESLHDVEVCSMEGIFSFLGRMITPKNKDKIEAETDIGKDKSYREFKAGLQKNLERFKKVRPHLSSVGDKSGVQVGGISRFYQDANGNVSTEIYQAAHKDIAGLLEKLEFALKYTVRSYAAVGAFVDQLDITSDEKFVKQVKKLIPEARKKMSLEYMLPKVQGSLLGGFSIVPNEDLVAAKSLDDLNWFNSANGQSIGTRYATPEVSKKEMIVSVKSGDLKALGELIENAYRRILDDNLYESGALRDLPQVNELRQINIFYLGQPEAKDVHKDYGLVERKAWAGGTLQNICILADNADNTRASILRVLAIKLHYATSLLERAIKA